MLIENVQVLDVVRGEFNATSVAIRDGKIVEPPHSSDPTDREERIDGRGAFLIPGLIDGHVHPLFTSLDMRSEELNSVSYTTLVGATNLTAMLDRGFTTIRDMGGLDYGVAAALAEGVIRGPKAFYCGKMISQTGGHGDLRERGYRGPALGAFTFPVSTIADGVADVRWAARSELRTGADHLKIGLSGGVGSTTDRIDSIQYSDEEIAAVVAEAEAANRYVAGHAYTARAVNRGLALGVRSIEHGNMIDEESIELFLEHDAFLVPTLVTYAKMMEFGADLGLPPGSVAKLDGMLEHGLAALEAASDAGVNIVFGTDLLGPVHGYQLEEFTIRSQVVSNLEVIQSATITAARLLGVEDSLGRLDPGFQADMLLLKKNPLESIDAITDPDENLLLGVREGEVFYRKNSVGRGIGGTSTEGGKL